MKTYTNDQALEIIRKLIYDNYQDRKIRFAAAAGISPTYLTQIFSGAAPIPERILKMAGLRYSERVIINDKKGAK